MRLILSVIALALTTPLAFAADCPAHQRGSLGCPVYVAPESSPVDGSVTVAIGINTLLFGGIRPPNGFMVRISGDCYLNDNGPATGGLGVHLYEPYSNQFITPPGYKPMGPVSLWCDAASYVFARAW